eukprot:192068_1
MLHVIVMYVYYTSLRMAKFRYLLIFAALVIRPIACIPTVQDDRKIIESVLLECTGIGSNIASLVSAYIPTKLVLFNSAKYESYLGNTPAGTIELLDSVGVFLRSTKLNVTISTFWGSWDFPDQQIIWDVQVKRNNVFHIRDWVILDASKIPINRIYSILFSIGVDLKSKFDVIWPRSPTQGTDIVYHIFRDTHGTYFNEIMEFRLNNLDSWTSESNHSRRMCMRSTKYNIFLNSYVATFKYQNGY